MRLRSSFVFTGELSVLATLALGIGLFTLVETLKQSVLDHPLPLPSPEHVVQIEQVITADGVPAPLEHFTLAELRILQSSARSFECVVGVDDGGKEGAQRTIGPDGRPEQVDVMRVAGPLTACLQVAPQLGRDPGIDEEATGEEIALASGYWGRRFSRSPTVVGDRIVLGNRPRTIVGVLPPVLGGDPARDLLRLSTDIWVPLDETRAQPNDRSLRLIARMRPGIDPRDAARELDLLLGGEGGDRRFRITDLRHVATSSARTSLLQLRLAGAVVLVLTIFNAMGLFLVACIRRSRSMAVRGALGATRRQLLATSVLRCLCLAASSGVLALALCHGTITSLVRDLPDLLPRFAEVEVRLPVLRTLLLCSLAAATALVVTVSLVSRPAELVRSLGEAGSMTPSRRLLRFHQRVVQVEVAAAIALLFASGLLVRSTFHTVRAEHGFDVDRLLAVDLHRAATGYPADRSADPATPLERMRDHVAGLPGVESAAVTSSVPFRTRDFRHRTWWLRAVDEHFFDATGMTLLAGRPLAPVTGGLREREAVVSRAFARLFMPGRSPVGQLWDGTYRIVGVVEDTRYRSLEEIPSPVVYTHHRNVGDPKMSLLIRSPLDMAALLPEIERAIWAVDPEQPVAAAAAVAALARNRPERVRHRMVTAAMSLFTGYALLLVTFGVYSAVTLHATLRAREYALREALGARHGSVRLLAVRRCLRLLRGGVIAGLAAALLVASALEDLLFRTSPNDPAMLAVALSWVLATVAVATVLGLRRTRRLDLREVLTRA